MMRIEQSAAKELARRLISALYVFYGHAGQSGFQRSIKGGQAL
jgi:hypothetical protein